MKYFAFIMGVGLLTASIFGFVGMNHANMNCDPGVANSTCPPSQVGMTFHHILSYGDYIQAIVPTESGAVLAVILLLIVMFIFVRYVIPEPILQVSRSRLRENRKSFFSQYRMTRWLSLLENSPSAYPQH